MFSALFFGNFLRRNTVHWKHKCNEGRTLPGSARNVEGTIYIKRHLGGEGMAIPVSPYAV